MKPALRIVAIFVCLLAPILLVQSGGHSNEINNPSPERLTVLVLGKDNASELSDVIMLTSVDTVKREVCILQIPRDTYVNLDEGYKKLNGMSKKLGGDDKLCRAIEKSMGVNIDGYVSFDTGLVERMVDLLGGVELEVPVDMDYDDPYQDLSIHLKKGKHKLNGKEAVGFVRYRKGYLRADIGRIDAQKIFVAAFARTALEKLGKKDIAPVAGLALRYVKTDLPVNQLISLASAICEITPEKIGFATMPGEEVKSQKSGVWFYILSNSGCAELLKIIGVSEEFDKDRIYSDATRAEFEEIYNKEIKARIYNAAEIDGEGIEITPK